MYRNSSASVALGLYPSLALGPEQARPLQGTGRYRDTPTNRERLLDLDNRFAGQDYGLCGTFRSDSAFSPGIGRGERQPYKHHPSLLSISTQQACRVPVDRLLFPPLIDE